MSEAHGDIPSWQLDPVDELTLARQQDRLLAQLFDVTVDLRKVGAYLIEDKLGEGSMGVVYVGHDPVLDRKLAIKLPRSDDPVFVRRFVREAEAMARVVHPNTAQIYEVGEHDGRAFIAMQLLEGLTLREWLAQSGRSSQAILDVFLAAGRGLAAIHQSELVHRDFKPGNVMVDANGQVCVTDFGLAGDRGERWSRLTREGALLGTPRYMSPEQARGQVVGARSDQFSFCVALYEALHGVLPFSLDAKGMPRFVEIGAGQARPAELRSGVSHGVESALARGLRLEPADRFADMAQLLAALADESAKPEPEPELAPSVTIEPSAHVDTLAVGRRGTQEHLASTMLDAEQSGRAEPSLASERERRGAHIGPFMVLRKLGQGGMGVVYAAYDPELDRRVAIKLLRPTYQGKDALARLQREAQGLARLSHPNVVQVHQIGEHRDKVFIAMEYVEGQTLREWCLTTSARPWREILDILLQAGHGLEAAHAAKLVHRDFKPANMMVGDDGRVRVLDFGLVRKADPSHLDASGQLEVGPGAGAHLLVTAAGLIVGTPAYMSLEQLEGERADASSDQFSFCVTAFEALYGQRPFVARDIAGIMVALRKGEVLPRPTDTDVPRHLHEVLVRGLASDPADRWPDMSTLLAELEAILDRSRSRWVWAVGGALAGVALLGLVGTPWVQRRLDAKNDEIVEQDKLLGEKDKQLAERQRERERERERERDVRIGLSLQMAANSPGQHLDTLLLGLETYANYAPADVPAAVEAGLFAVTRDLHRARVLAGHEGVILDFDYSLRGDWIATASRDDSARLWSSDEGEELLELHSRDDVRAIEFSDDGEHLATVSGDGTATLWDVRMGTKLDTISGYDIRAARLSPSGDELAVGTRDGELLLHAIASDGELGFDRALQDHGAAILGLAYSPNAAHLLAISDGIRLWNLGSDKSWLLVDGAPDSAALADFSPDGTRIAAADDSGTLRLWTGAGAMVATLTTEPGMSAVAFDPREPRLVSVSRSSPPEIWSSQTGERLVEVEGHPRGATDAAFSPDGRRLATVSYDGMVRVCDTSTGRIVETFESHHEVVSRVRYSPDGSQIATIGDDAFVRVWHTSRAVERSVELADRGEFVELELAHARSRAITVGHDGRARIWDADSGRELHELHHDGARVITAAISPDGRRVATSDKHRTHVWDVDTGLHLHAGAEGRSSIVSLALGPKGKLLVTGDKLGRVRAWSLDGAQAELKWERTLVGDVRVSALAVSADGEAIAAGSLSPVVKVWSGSGEALGHLETPNAINALSFSPDAALLAVVGEFRQVQLWDLGSHERLELVSAQTALHAVAFSPDGGRVISSGDTLTQLWSLADRAELAQLVASAERVRDLGFSADGGRVFAADGQGRIVTIAASAEQRSRIGCAFLRDVGADLDLPPRCDGS